MSSRAEFSALPPSTQATCSGGNASLMISAITALVAGEYAEGFTTTQLPAATAFASGSMASMNG